MEDENNNEYGYKLNEYIYEEVKEIKNILNKYIDTLELIEKKIKSETNERKLEESKIYGLSDYDKIILTNLESRISILEEETEKYTMIH